jgi:hypothetical protein
MQDSYTAPSQESQATGQSTVTAAPASTPAPQQKPAPQQQPAPASTDASACSPDDRSADAVHRCVNAMRTNPHAWSSHYKCDYNHHHPPQKRPHPKKKLLPRGTEASPWVCRKKTHKGRSKMPCTSSQPVCQGPGSRTLTHTAPPSHPAVTHVSYDTRRTCRAHITCGAVVILAYQQQQAAYRTRYVLLPPPPC